MNDQHCADCRYYFQHYALNKNRLFRVYCGHCTQEKIKRKRPDDKACERFSPGTKDEQDFATKEYLSKELLKYVLSLDLLPEIKDADSSRNSP